MSKVMCFTTEIAVKFKLQYKQEVTCDVFHYENINISKAAWKQKVKYGVNKYWNCHEF